MQGLLYRIGTTSDATKKNSFGATFFKKDFFFNFVPKE